MSFVHLHTHSHYSMLDGLAKIADLVAKAVEYKQPALALTDHGNLYGAIEFYQKATAAGIKPIIGMEAYLTPGDLRSKQSNVDARRVHLLLLAKNNVGYKNLIKLSTVAHLEGFYYKPRIDKRVLREYSEGLIVLSGCMGGEIPRALLNNDEVKAEKLAREYQEIFGADNFYIELSHHPGLPRHDELQKKLRALAQKCNVPVVATQDIHYVNQEDAHAHDVLLAVQTNTKLDDQDRLTMKKDDFSFRSTDEMKKLFADIPEAIENTVRIADQVDMKIELGQTKLPRFSLPAGVSDSNLYLRELCLQGLQKRYGKSYDELVADESLKTIADRLDYELSVIGRTGFADYFLIVQDFVNWAKIQGIVVGPGRGSAAGSLIAYVLNITNVNPLKYDLLFERFMNPDRISWPDIDLDFADTRRDEVFDYLIQKYGSDHVAQIITFGTMAARAAVRDSGRALGLSYSLCDEIAKMIPFNASLDKAIESVPELHEQYENSEEAKQLIDAAKKLEGVVRHASVHACGLVITPQKITENIPLQLSHSSGSDKKRDTVVTQFEMHAIEELGFLKIDLLGLKNLSIIEDTLHLIRESGETPPDINNLNLDDSKPYKLLAAGNTVGVFQLESSGMTRFLKELVPTNIEDIVAMITLYRPGTLDAGMVPRYIARKRGLEQVEYLHPKLEPILKDTYGTMIYQEQLMRVAQDLASYSLAEADVLRKAVGKKIKALLAGEKEKFIKGVTATTGSKSLANELWTLIEPFGRYGFNRSHAVAYAFIAYQTAYLKTYWPLEFMTALMNADSKDVDRIAFFVNEAKKLSIEVLPPDINESNVLFTPLKEEGARLDRRQVGQAIRFGLGSIKNVGHPVVEAIIAERNKNDTFTSFSNFLERIYSKDLNKKSLESLIKAGALDEFGERNQMLCNVQTALLYNKEASSALTQRQDSLFALVDDQSSIPSLRLESAVPAALSERLRWEKELVGLYISGHPLEKFKEMLKNMPYTIEKAKALPSGAPVRSLAAMISNVKKIITKKGEPMAFLRLKDLTDEIEAVVFPRTLSSLQMILSEDECVMVRGKLSHRNGEISIICDGLEELRQ